MSPRNSPTATESGLTREERRYNGARNEFLEAGREILNESGMNAVTINAIARRVGVSGPAVYHYFKNVVDLGDALSGVLMEDLTTSLERVYAGNPAALPSESLMEVNRAMRQWFRDRPREFEWIFARQIDDANVTDGTVRSMASRRLDYLPLSLASQVYRLAPFATPPLEGMSPALIQQLEQFSERTGNLLPPAAAYVFLDWWARLYGLLAMEILGQNHYALTDLGPFFEQYLVEMTAALQPIAPSDAATP